MKAYGKLNLYLKILGKTENNYHNLQMVNIRINLYDSIYIKEIKDEKDKIIYLNDLSLSYGEDDIIFKTLQAFKKIYNIDKKYQIKIKKRIPVGAGLGGASMDVGCVLDKIIKKEKIKITKEEKIAFTKNFGADIPYSFFDEACLVEEIGEKIKPIKISVPKLIMIYPNINISTKEVFKNVSSYSKKRTPEEIIKDVNSYNYQNDLFDVALKINEEFFACQKAIQKIEHTYMSGSGSTLFVKYDKKILHNLKKTFPTYIIKVIKMKRRKKWKKTKQQK